MIITAEDPQIDPLTVGVLPMAVEVGGGPAVQFVHGAYDYSAHRVVVFLGHGEPGGELTKVDSAELIADLTDDARGLQDGATLLLWSCFAAAGQNPDESLVAKLRKAFAGKKRVEVSGVPGAMYSNTSARELWYGPTKATKNATSEAAEVIKSIEGHAWMETGMLAPVPILGAMKNDERPGYKKVTVTIGGANYVDWVQNFMVKPASVDIALKKLVENRKLPAAPVTAEGRKAAIVDAVKKWYEVFFGHRIIQAYIATGVITQWKQGGL